MGMARGRRIRDYFAKLIIPMHCLYFHGSLAHFRVWIVVSRQRGTGGVQECGIGSAWDV